MKTIKKWISELPEPIRGKALRAMKHVPFCNPSDKRPSMSRALGSAFYWTLTEDGGRYWLAIFCRAEDGEFDEKKPKQAAKATTMKAKTKGKGKPIEVTLKETKDGRWKATVDHPWRREPYEVKGPNRRPMRFARVFTAKRGALRNIGGGRCGVDLRGEPVYRELSTMKAIHFQIQRRK